MSFGSKASGVHASTLVLVGNSKPAASRRRPV
jgi:hypothetical protein